MNKITFLGVWMTPDVGETVSFIVDTDTGERILVDCGTNLVKGMMDANIDPNSITHLFITHSHGDHISGLPTYLFYRIFFAPGIYNKKLEKLKIFGTKDVLNSIKNYISIAYGDLYKHPSINYECVDVNNSIMIGNLNISFFKTLHPVDTIGFRIITNKKTSLVYTSDTAFSEKVLEKASGADILIHDIAATSKYSFLAGGHTLCNQISPFLDKYLIKAIVPVHRLPIYKFNTLEYLNELSEKYSGVVIMKNDGEILEFE